jgi:hypothetical protein
MAVAESSDNAVSISDRLIGSVADDDGARVELL